jgi:hypothetical protein
MSARKSADGTAEHVIPIARASESRFSIDGQSYRLCTWTAAQWGRLREADRPRASWPHGDGWAIVEKV